MNISLRRAAALQNSIQDAIKDIRLVTSVKLNEFQDAELELANARKQHIRDLDRQNALLEAYYAIRQAVANANAIAISDLLTKVALLDKQIKIYSDLAGHQPRVTESVIAGRLEKIRNNREETYYRDPVVESGIFTTDDLDQLKQHAATLRRTRQRYQDQILELNVRTEITLDDASEATLRQENLI